MTQHSTARHYIGTKLVIAQALCLGAYNQLRGWTMPEGEDPNAPGYLVEYTDGGKPNHPDHAGYISWSPADVFEKSYKATDGMPFGLALELVKAGKTIRRKGWNGAGQFVYMVTGDKLASALGYGFGEYLNEPTFSPMLVLRNTQNRLNSWVPSTGDLFANDWELAQ